MPDVEIFHAFDPNLLPCESIRNKRKTKERFSFNFFQISNFLKNHKIQLPRCIKKKKKKKKNIFYNFLDIENIRKFL